MGIPKGKETVGFVPLGLQACAADSSDRLVLGKRCLQAFAARLLQLLIVNGMRFASSQVELPDRRPAKPYHYPAVFQVLELNLFSNESPAHKVTLAAYTNSATLANLAH